MNAAARKRVETPAQQSPQFQDTIARVSASPRPANAETSEDRLDIGAQRVFDRTFNRPFDTVSTTGSEFNNSAIPGPVARRLTSISTATQGLETVLGLLEAESMAAYEAKPLLGPYAESGLHAAAAALMRVIRDEVEAVAVDYPPERSP